MKKLIIMSVLLISSFSYKAADAQVRVNLNVNLGNQPSWGPSGHQFVDYYYLPDINVYYHVPSRKYTYLNGNRWVNSRNLPRQYRNYDLHRGQKVVMNRPSPWLRQQSNARPYAMNQNRNHQYDHRNYNSRNNYKKDYDRKDKGRDRNDRNNGRGRG